ncbi:MAG: amino acid ABC transporter permease [Pseudomonadota bacterium]
MQETLANPWMRRLIAVIVLTGLIAWAVNAGALFGLEGAPATLVRWAGALVLALLLVANAMLIRLLPFRFQVPAVWAELVILFFGFFASFDLSYQFIGDRLPFLLGLRLNNGFFQGAAMTVFISLVSIACASTIALAAAYARLSSNGMAFGISTFYVSFFRGTPLLLQVMLIYLGLPQLGIVLDAIPAGIIALSLCYGAYLAEIFRAGILSIPKEQREGAMALGLTPFQIQRLVVLPQALRVIVPPTGNMFIAMLKDSALVSIMGVWELTYLAQTHGRSEFKYMEMLIAAAVVYWILSGIFEFVQSRIERRLGRSVRGSGDQGPSRMQVWTGRTA